MPKVEGAIVHRVGSSEIEPQSLAPPAIIHRFQYCEMCFGIDLTHRYLSAHLTGSVRQRKPT